MIEDESSQKYRIDFCFVWTSIDKFPNLENVTWSWSMMQCNNNTQVYHTFDQTLKYMTVGNVYLSLSKQGSWWFWSPLICFNDRNINAEIVQVSATQKLVVFLQHKGIGTTRRKTKQGRKCRDGKKERGQEHAIE